MSTSPRFHAEVLISETENGTHIDATFTFNSRSIATYRREMVSLSLCPGELIDELISDAIDYAKGYQFNNEE